jgi:hypothetical protein
VPWRFSDAGKHRAWFKRCDEASEKPAQELPLVNAAANVRIESILLKNSEWRSSAYHMLFFRSPVSNIW